VEVKVLFDLETSRWYSEYDFFAFDAFMAGMRHGVYQPAILEGVIQDKPSCEGRGWKA